MPGSRRAAPSGERVIDTLVFVLHSLFALLNWFKDSIGVCVLSENVRRVYIFGTLIKLTFFLVRGYFLNFESDLSC